LGAQGAAAYYSPTGRPSIDPVLMIRMLIVGYVFAIRSERQLCAEVQVNLAYRWFCKLGIEDKIPDHSVFCRARHERFRDSDALRRVFEGVVAMCIAAGLVGGEAFSVDASLIKADVDKKKRVPGDQPIEHLERHAQLPFSAGRWLIAGKRLPSFESGDARPVWDWRKSRGSHLRSSSIGTTI
jgi:transposase